LDEGRPEHSGSRIGECLLIVVHRTSGQDSAIRRCRLRRCDVVSSLLGAHPEIFLLLDSIGCFQLRQGPEHPGIGDLKVISELRQRHRRIKQTDDVARKRRVQPLRLQRCT
jgi:hypothetical protein